MLMILTKCRICKKYLNSPLDVKELIEEQIETLLPNTHKVTNGFKILDSMVDITSLILEPTVNNTKVFLLGLTYLYCLYNGANGYSLVISIADAHCKIYQGEYVKRVLNQLTLIYELNLFIKVQKLSNYKVS